MSFVSSFRACITSLTLAAMLATPAFAQDSVKNNPDGTTTISPSNDSKPPPMSKATRITLNYIDTPIWDLLIEFANRKRMNFVLGDPKDLQSKKVTIISHHPVSVNAAYEAFIAALEVSGYTISTVGDTSKVIKLGEASQHPIQIGTGMPRASDQMVTQLITLENVRVDDVNKVLTSGGMAGPNSKIIAYPPTNTMIITDTANNIRKLYRIMQELDVAAPKSTLKIVPVQYASAEDVKAMIDELYGIADSDTSKSTTSSRSSRRSSRRSKDTPADPLSAGVEAKYISKVISDERTNSLVILANEDGHKAVLDLLERIDVDADPQRRAQIHVVNLEHAKAADVANVLSQLSQNSTSTSSSKSKSRTSKRTPTKSKTSSSSDKGQSSGAIAAFDSGMRIAPDENTNSLVIIANIEDFAVVKTVIDELDRKRKQVYVDAVILELSSEDGNDFAIAAHAPQTMGDAIGFVGAQLGTNSLGLSTDALSGLAVGVYGESIEVPFNDPTGLIGDTMSIPAFGIALNAIKTSGSTNIISNPNLTTLDNEEASIVVGRKIPFPTSQALSALGQPVVSFQREDVAITLEITPRVNSSDFVTLELNVEVQEVENGSVGQAAAASSGGFITSKRELKTVALVKDNQTMVVGGLMGTTDRITETKVPILGDIPVIGALFRQSTKSERKSNLMIFITPHIIDDESDVLEIQRVKEAQRREFIRRFYGKSRDEYMDELRRLLRYSMNNVDEPSMFRGPTEVDAQDLRLDGDELSEQTREAIQEALDSAPAGDPGSSAGSIEAGGQ